jgi:hypothetical protein
MYVQYQGMSIVEKRRADSDSVAKCAERTATVYDMGLQLYKRCSDRRKLLIERSDLVSESAAF